MQPQELNLLTSKLNHLLVNATRQPGHSHPLIPLEFGVHHLPAYARVKLLCISGARERVIAETTWGAVGPCSQVRIIETGHPSSRHPCITQTFQRKKVLICIPQPPGMCGRYQSA